MARSRAAAKPNIVVIWGDDIGITNLSCYSDGLMGYRTPNIDRIAQEGMRFTDCYGEQSCTAGRSSFITGQHGLRTGLTKVGLPAATVGLHKEDPTIAALLKPLGYATAQIGKNHLGDRNEYLPTVHGFDEFYGNLYHLNAEEEPELPDYPKGSDFPHFRERFGPRGVLECKATNTDDATIDPRFGRLGKQTVHDTGPLTKKRMETIDDDIAGRSVDFIKRQAQAGQPFFLWVNFTHMHFRTHVKPESRGQSGRWQSEYHDVMIDHDKNVGTVLKALDDAGIADNTFVMYSTDNGPNMFSWPDGAMTPFRNEKNTNWEGAFRVPCVVRWPGKIKPGSVSNEIVAHHDWLPTFLAMAGDTEVTDKLLKGYTIGDMTYKVHLDGHNLLPYLTGQAEKSPRVSFIYCNDDQQVVALRYDNWKIVFAEQREPGTMRVWSEPFVTLRVPKLFKGDHSGNRYHHESDAGPTGRARIQGTRDPHRLPLCHPRGGDPDEGRGAARRGRQLHSVGHRYRESPCAGEIHADRACHEGRRALHRPPADLADALQVVRFSRVAGRPDHHRGSRRRPVPSPVGRRLARRTHRRQALRDPRRHSHHAAGADPVLRHSRAQRGAWRREAEPDVFCRSEVGHFVIRRLYGPIEPFLNPDLAARDMGEMM
jgi:arylsulfatase